MPKSICIITTVDATISAFIIPTAMEMQKQGFDVTLMCSMSDKFVTHYKGEFHLLNVNMERGAKPIGMIKAIWIFYQIFRKEKFDIVQYATPNAAFYASIASCLAGCKRRLYCQWGIRYVGFSGINRMLFKVLEKITCVLSTHIRPASQKNLEFAVSEGLYKTSKAQVVGNGGTIGVDLKQFDISSKELLKQEVIQRHPMLKDKMVFGFIGRLDRDKGVNELFEAFIKLNKDQSEIALVVLGSFDKPEGISSDILTAIKSLPNVLFTGFTTEVSTYLSAFDFLVHPSYREGFSMVIQQAMAMGVCVITTDIPGPSEVIVDGVSGITVKAKSSEDLYSAMRQLYDNREKSSLYAAAGLERCHMLFNRERMINLTLQDRNNIYNK